eukprot:TRINITY_DN5134_c0_g1_i2.p1 TRINITY_DN5134_c0_g1~~TRINITY_DN5134_c0_g1_i2.p1  ORF type:complete len:693 (+),score=134.51 TRINITY_DN5134_c0_g1_i2:143-2221(+)
MRWPIIFATALILVCARCEDIKLTEIKYEAENAHGTSSVLVDHDRVIFREILDDSEPGHLIFTVFAPTDDYFPTTFRYTHNGEVTASELFVRVNGHPYTSLVLSSWSSGWFDHTEDMPLRQGLNTIVLQNRNNTVVSLDYITIVGTIQQASRGATLPYFEIEAEAASTNAEIIGPDRTYMTLPSEASGRRAVQLTAQGHYVEFTLSSSANAMVVRLSIPDTSNGQGNNGYLGVYVNGQYYMNLTVTSHFSWAYGAYPFTKNPGDGSPHHFYDETRSLFRASLPAGTKVRLEGMSPFSYTIDLADFYTVPAPYAQPSNFLPVTQFGADPSGTKDSTSAIQAAISAAQSQGKGVWIPSGTFLVSQRFTLNNVVVRGAGPWYSIVKATVNHGVGFFGNWAPNPSKNVELYDFAIFGDTNVRDDGAVDSGSGGALDGNSIVQNMWIEHTKCGMWLDGPFQGLHVVGTTIRNTYADGINLHLGISNVVVEQCMLRNLGDDGLAMWSQTQPDVNNLFRFNTIQVPVLANTIAIYGGTNNAATDNLLVDSVCEGGGLQASNRFGSVPLSGTTVLARNTVIRCGAPNRYNTDKNGAMWFWAGDAPMNGIVNVTDIDILDSSYSASTFWGSQISNMYFSRMNINTAPYAFSVRGVTGQIYVDNTIATNLTSKGVCSCNPAGFAIKAGPGNSGWDTQECSSC